MMDYTAKFRALAQETSSLKHPGLACPDVRPEARDLIASTEITSEQVRESLAKKIPHALDYELPLCVSWFKSQTDTAPTRIETSWGAFRDFVFRAPPDIRADKMTGQLYSPVTYRAGATRGNAGVEAITMAVLDCDAGDNPDEATHNLTEAGAAFAIHDTFSSTAQQRKFRLIVPLQTSYAPAQHEQLINAVAALAGVHPDPKTKDVARMFLPPTWPAASPQPAPAPIYNHGNILTAHEWIAKAKAAKHTLEAAPRHAKAKTSAQAAADDKLFAGVALALTPADYHDLNAVVDAELSRIESAAPFITLTAARMAFNAPDLSEMEAWTKGVLLPLRNEALARPASKPRLRKAFDTASAKIGGSQANNDTQWNAQTRAEAVTLNSYFSVAIAGGWRDPITAPATLPAPSGFASVAANATPIETNAATCTTDLCLAQRFAEENHEHLRWVPDWGCWIGWQGSGWDRIADNGPQVHDHVKALIHVVAGEIIARMRSGHGGSVASAIARLQSRALIDNVLALAKREKSLVINANKLDADPMLLRCRNAVVNLETGQAIPVTRDQFMTRCAAVDFDPAATCPTWERTILECNNGDMQQVRLLQKFAGLATTASTKHKKISVLYGPQGNNGKTLIVETLFRLMGSYSINLSTNALTCKPDAGATAERLLVEGCRFAKTSEWPKQTRLDVQFIKDLTGGDTYTAKAMHGMPRHIRPGAKLFVVGNHLPVIGEISSAIWDRLLPMKYDRVFSPNEQDKDLMDKLRNEWPGILNWLMRGFHMLQSEGWNSTAVMDDLRDQWRQDSDPLSDWRETCTRDDPKARTSRADLYSRYVNYCNGTGTRPMSNQAFNQALTERGCEPYKVNGTRGFIGIALVPSPAEAARGQPAENR